MQKEFAWIDDGRGELIEDFIHRTTIKNPFLMREVLKLGFGDLTTWTDTNVVVGARCGCLIGSCAIAAARLGMVDAAKVRRSPSFNLVPKTLALAVAHGNKANVDKIRAVGCAVSDECDEFINGGFGNHGSRQEAVRMYLEDLIETDLCLLGIRV